MKVITGAIVSFYDMSISLSVSRCLL